MGYTVEKHAYGEITNFWPDDDDNTMYVETTSSASILYLLDRIKEKWPDAEPDELNIMAEYIHTHCLYYDRYDATDYTNFLVIRKIK